MAIAAEEHIGETAGIADHDHDLIHDLSRRLDFLWRVDQYIANAEGHGKLLEFWKEAKEQEIANVERLRALVRNEIKSDCF